MKSIVIILSVLILCSCASSTIIKTIPDGARVKQGNELKGITPYEHWDRSTSYASSTFTLQMEGFKDKEVTITKDSFYIHRIFILPVLSWPWIFGYQPSYFFELEKIEKPKQ